MFSLVNVKLLFGDVILKQLISVCVFVCYLGERYVNVALLTGHVGCNG